jgi:DNA-binding NtrC family response regulator
VRVVTATNRNLEQAVKDGEFRQDLFFRLQVLEIAVAPLRDHPEDIPQIARHLLARMAARSAVKVKGFTQEALDVLCEYWWPGNVRELKNVIERSVILSDHTWLTADDVRLLNLGRPTPLTPSVAQEIMGRPPDTAGLESTMVPSSPFAYPPQRSAPLTPVEPWERLVDQEASLEEMERQFIAATLEKLAWNKSRTARQLGIERTTLDRKIKKYGLEKPE